MTVKERMIKGIKVASIVTGVSTRQASLQAGFNQNQLVRFFSGNHDIMLNTLEDICVKGYGLSFDKVYEFGGAAE